MKALFAIALAMGLTFAACTDNTAPTEPTNDGLNKRTQSKFDLDGYYMWNPCCSTYITLEGTIHNNSEFTLNPDGSWSLKGHGNYQGVSGTDSDGNTYRVVGSSTSSSTWEATGAYTYRAVYHTRMQATGGNDGCTFVIKQIIDYSIDEDGNLTVKQNRYEIECV